MPNMWNLRAKIYDFCEGSGLRRGHAKTELFAEMDGRVLFAAVGTGADILHFPARASVVAIDINPEMLRRAAGRQKAFQGSLDLVEADLMRLPFSDEAFDMVATSCTMCSVPDPVCALRELHRVLKPEGRLLMFEHVRSQNPVLGMTLDLMTLWTRRAGTEMNRNTIANAQRAGFQITQIQSVYLDIILAIHGVKLSSHRQHC